MGTAETIYILMRKDEFLASIPYREDRLQHAERLAAFHGITSEAARNALTAQQRPGGPQALLVAL